MELDNKTLSAMSADELNQMAETIKAEHGNNMDAWPVEVWNTAARIQNELTARRAGITYEALMADIPKPEPDAYHVPIKYV